MKKFIKKILLFSVPVIVCFLAFEIFLRQIPNIYSLKNDYLVSNAAKVETLVLGNSHTLYGMNPEFIGHNSFNAANVSQTLPYDLEILKKFESDLKNLKTVIVPVSYLSLFFNLKDNPEKWRIKNYYLYYGIDTPFDLRNRTEIFGSRFETSAINTIEFLLGHKPELTELGWGDKYTIEDSRDLTKTAKTAVERHTAENHDLLDENIAALTEIAQICRKHNAKLILFTPPVYKTYYTTLDEKQLEVMMASIDAFLKKHPDAAYLNLLKDGTFIKEDYYDADHLNNLGAKKLSLFFNEYLSKQK